MLYYITSSFYSLYIYTFFNLCINSPHGLCQRKWCCSFSLCHSEANWHMLGVLWQGPETAPWIRQLIGARSPGDTAVDSGRWIMSFKDEVTWRNKSVVNKHFASRTCGWFSAVILHLQQRYSPTWNYINCVEGAQWKYVVKAQRWMMKILFEYFFIHTFL